MSDETIGDCYEVCHQWIHFLFQRYRESKGSDHENAKTYFEDLKREIEWHIFWEEEIFLPRYKKIAFSSYTALTCDICNEHKGIKRALKLVENKIGMADLDCEHLENILLACLQKSYRRRKEVFLLAEGRMAESFLWSK